MAEQRVTREDRQGDTLSRRAPPLTLENVYEAVKRVRKWRELGNGFLLYSSKLDAIRDQHGSDEEACLKAVIEAFLRGKGLSWRRVIWALYKAGENHIAHDIITYAEPVQDPTMTVDGVTQVFNKIKGDKAKVMRSGVGLDIPSPLVDEIMERSYSTESEKSRAFADVYVNIHPKASWEHLTRCMYMEEEFASARESKSFMSTDPTLNMDNVSRVMKKVEPEKREQVWESVLVIRVAYDAINRQYSPEERESACVDIYVHCCSWSSWTDIAASLYYQHQVVAVEELRSYLPPRDLTITTEKLKEQFTSLDPEKVDNLGDGGWLDLPESEVDNIKSSYDSPMQRKEAYLDLYVHQHPCPSWARIARILEVFGLRRQAYFVKNTYVKGTQDTSSSVVSN